MEKRTKILHALICDDVRREITGKETLVGVVGDEIFTPTFPIIYHITLWIRAIFDFDGLRWADFEIRTADGIRLLQSQKLPLHTQRNKSTTVVVQGVPIQIQSPCDVEVRWKLPEEEWETVATLGIRQGKVQLPPGVMVEPSATSSLQQP